MIRYALVCDREHGFESWFRDSEGFDTLVAAAQVQCPSCGSVRIRKALMAPSVVTARRKASAPVPAATPVEAPEPKPVALIDERTRALREALRALHKQVTETADNVGRAFPEEARRIHEGDAPQRSIYGEATPDQVAALLEDGVPLMPMPVLPDDQN